jgi:hypothetical protein
MAIGDIVRLKMRGTMHGHVWQSGCHFQYQTLTATAQGLASHWQSMMMPSLLTATCGDIRFEDIFVEARLPALAETWQVAYGTNTVGQLSGEAPPGQLAAAIDFRTGRKGGRFRGRMLLPAGAMATILDGRYTGASLTALDTVAGALTDNYVLEAGSDDYKLIVFSPEKVTNLRPGEKPRPGNVNTFVTSVLRRDIVRTLRRRAIGQGI